jgi:hypothetical protein
MDLILINGKIYTMAPDRHVAEAIAISGGKIAAVGSNIEIIRLSVEGTSVIDLHGKVVLPGFNDSHVHLLNYGYSLTKVDCSGASSIDEIVDRGISFIKDNNLASGEWLLGRGWNDIMLSEKREINRHDLDRISPDHPMSFTRICEHITVANSKALEMCKITRDTPQPLGGQFDLDENGEPTGIFRESARYLIYENIPDVTKEDIKRMLKQVMKKASSLGITSVQTDDFDTFANRDYDMIIKAYRELAEEGELPVRVYQQCILPESERLDAFIAKGYRTGQGDGFYKIGPLKLLTDGSLGARTAFLKEPYSDDPATRGISVFTQDELDYLVTTAHSNGMQILTHAIGDGAMEMCFKSFEKALMLNPMDDPRFGIVHLQITDVELLNKFKELNVIAYAEPICVNNDLHMAEERVGSERIRTSYNYRTLLENGVPMCISSDCPVDSLNPMDSLYVAVTRKDYSGYPEQGWYESEKLSLDQAVYCFTMGSAYASFEEQVKGSLETGKYADMVVLSEDIFSIAPEQIRNVQAEMTIMNGEVLK